MESKMTLEELESKYGSKRRKYLYYDTPDYADPHKKLIFAAKHSLVLGFTMSVLQGFRGRPTTVTQLVNLSGYYPPLFVSGALVFSGAQIATAYYRQKDDWVNHFVGGLAFGSFVGLYKRSAFRGLQFGIFAAAIMAGLKSTIGTDGFDPRRKTFLSDPDAQLNLIPGGGYPDPGRRTF